MAINKNERRKLLHKNTKRSITASGKRFFFLIWTKRLELSAFSHHTSTETSMGSSVGC